MNMNRDLLTFLIFAKIRATEKYNCFGKNQKD